MNPQTARMQSLEVVQSNNPSVCKHHEPVQIARTVLEVPQVYNLKECSEPKDFHCCFLYAYHHLHHHHHRILLSY
jgi:hypothetical protein